MGPQFTRSLVEILSSTLQKLEETSDFRQDDLAVIELKRHIVRTIAELEITKSTHFAHTNSNADQFSGAGGTGSPPPSTESGRGALAGSGAGTIEPAAAPAASLEPLVAEPAAENTDMPLLAENGPTTSS